MSSIMSMPRFPFRSQIATSLAVLLAGSPAAPIAAAVQAPAKTAPAPATPAPAKTAPAKTAAAKTAPAKGTGVPAAPTAPDGDWPRVYSTQSKATLVIYQPQIASWV